MRERCREVLTTPCHVGAETRDGRKALAGERLVQPPVGEAISRGPRRCGAERAIHTQVELVLVVAQKRRRDVVADRHIAIRERIQAGDRTADGIHERRRNPVAGEGLPRERIARGRQGAGREVPLALGQGRHGGQACRPLAHPRALVDREHERAVLLQRPSDRPAELVPLVIWRRLVAGREVVARVQSAVPKELVRRAAPAVRTGPRNHVDLCSAVSAEGRIVGAGDHLELPDGIDRHPHADTVQLRIDVVDAVEQVRVAVLARTVRVECEVASDRGGRTGSGRDCPWREERQLEDVAAVEREAGDEAIVEHRATPRQFRFPPQGRGDRQLLGDGDAQLRLNPDRLSHVQRQAADVRRVPGRNDLQPVRARGEMRDRELTGPSRFGLPPLARFFTHDRHRTARDGLSGGVTDRAAHRAVNGLRSGARDEHRDEQQGEYRDDRRHPAPRPG